MVKIIKLKVAEAIQDDVNKGIVRIDSSYMHEIGVRPGDIVSITGERETVGIVDRAYPGDIGLNIIRMDGLIRRNGKTGIGEVVNVYKADVKEAKKIIIAPSKKGIMIRASPMLFKQGLLGRALLKGDIVSLGGQQRRRSTMSQSPFFNDVFNILDESMMGFGFGDLKFIVVDTNPKQAVIVSELTEVVFNPEPVESVEEKSLEVTYEDIGGLNEEIKKVREMVELPLKHPEIFERLGIEAPKGVLLHGPPGTGKTLLAKAVANETNANFILINGPEIMSKFYGQSLPGDEKILISENNMLKRVPIGEVVDQGRQNIQVACFDDKGKIVLSPVTGLIKHKTQGKVYKVKTRSGRSIRVTNYHSLFTLGNTGIAEIKTSDLKVNESFIAIPKKIPLPSHPLEELDLLEALREEDYSIRIANGQRYLSEAIHKLGIREVAKILNVKEKYVYDLKNKNIGIPVSSFMKLVNHTNITINKDLLQIRTKGKVFPATLKFSEELWTFFGLWMAEGSYTTKNEVRLSIHRDEEKVVAQLCQRLFGQVLVYHKPNSQGTDIFICSGILGKIMKHVLRFSSGARKKSVPQLVYNLNKKNLSAFLRGYFSGDGHLNTKTPALMVEVCTESPDLADDIAYLLLSFGIIAKIYERKNRPQRRICFADYDNLEIFKEIGFLDSQRNATIYEYCLQKKFSRRDQIPLTTDVQEILRKNNMTAWKHSKSVGKNVLQKLESPILHQIIESDISWDKVVEIQEADAPEFVYDISVNPTQNFIAGFGGIFAHNSEENLRKKFEDAEKNAPSIIFIDEIDAIAAKREEVQGEVERRVVAQLLAIMDGLKSRGKVVVIAASNIPNALDPALRRPGRFDREIEIGVPRKEGRLKILKIHTRNMPINNDPTTLNPAWKREEITKGFQEFFAKLPTKDLVKSIPIEAENITLLSGMIEPRLKVALAKYIPADIKRSVKDFMRMCTDTISNEILDELKQHAETNEKGVVLIQPDKWISEKIREISREDRVENLISRKVTEHLLTEISEITHGFVGADLSALSKEAAMIVLRKILPDLELQKEEPIPKELLSKLHITRNDFFEALKVVRPSAMREVLVEIPSVKWEHIGGLEKVQQELIEAVEWPLKYPEVFHRMGVKPPKGILLYGPPGTGKTLLAKAVANESEANFILVNGPELISKWVGESERGIRKIFNKARQTSPSIIFFDEIDSIAPRRGVMSENHSGERVVNQLLTEMDGLQDLHDIVIIAATNRPDILDTALLRPGRFDRIIYVPPSDQAGREAIFRVHTQGMPIKNVDIKKLAEQTEGYVGADIEAVCREAAIMALRRKIDKGKREDHKPDMKIKEITMDHFEEALKKVRPSVTKEIEEAYRTLEEFFRSARGKEMKEDKPSYMG